MAMSATEIADVIKWFRDTYAAQSMGLIFLNDPDLWNWLAAKGYDKGSRIRLGRRDNTYYESLDLYHSIGVARGSATYNLNFMGMSFMMALSFVGDALSQNAYFDRTPELEFFRHVRNGISHGNRFHFEGREPVRPATFRAFAIDRALEGRTVLFEFLSTGDCFDLFDHIEAHLRVLP